MALIQPVDKNSNWNYLDSKSKLDPKKSHPLLYDEKLSNLIRFHSLFGISYGGVNCHYNDSTRKKSFFQMFSVTLLMLYDLLSTLLVILCEKQGLNNTIFEKLFRRSSEKVTINFVFYLAGYCYLLEFFIIKFVTFFSGRKIISILQCIGKKLAIFFIRVD